MIDSMTYFALKLFHTSLVISMPGNYFKTKIHYTQEKLDEALANIRNKNMIYPKAAEVYRKPESTLCDRITRKQECKVGHHGHLSVLSDKEEEDLLN